MGNLDKILDEMKEPQRLNEPSKNESINEGLMIKINNDSRFKATVRNLDVDVKYSALVSKMNEEFGLTLTQAKAKKMFNLFMEMIDFPNFDKLEEKE
jgi:uncharacterized lipoprotein YajG